MVGTRSTHGTTGEQLQNLTQHRRRPQIEESDMSMPGDKEVTAGLVAALQTMQSTLETMALRMEQLEHVEAKIDIPVFDGSIDAEKLDSGLAQMETYFTLYEYPGTERVAFARFKLTNHALAWWNGILASREGQGVTWEEFKRLLRLEFYPMGYLQDRWTRWYTLWQYNTQSVQEYTTEFRRLAVAFGVSINTEEPVQKFVAGLHYTIRQELQLFRVLDVSSASTTAMAIEAKNRGSNYKNSAKSKQKVSKYDKNHTSKDSKSYPSKSDFYCDHCKISGHNKDKCWKVHPELKPKRFKEHNRGKQINTVMARENEPERVGSMQQPDTALSLMARSDTVISTVEEEHAEELFTIKIQDVGQRVDRQCKVKFAITSRFIDEVICDVVPLDVCQVVLGSPYLWLRDGHYHRRAQEYELTKDGKQFVITRDNIASPTDLMTAGQVKRVVNACQKFVLLLVRLVQPCEKNATIHLMYMHEKEEGMLTKLLNSYTDLFEDPQGLPPRCPVEHEIHLQSDAPLPNLSMYRNSVLENDEIKRQVMDLLERGLVQHSSLPCGSPVVLVPKKDGGWCMCIDYRALNKITVKNRYPLPRIDDLLDQLKNARFFTKLDLKSGYHQVCIRDEDTWKTAFKTRQGLFEWKVMPFGLCNAPATFMHLMNDVLCPFLDKFVLVYLDDILIYSESWEDHEQHIRQVFEVLQQHQLRLNGKKCEFAKTSLIYLGFIVGGGTLRIDPDKVDVILLAAPLHALTKAHSKFEWTEKCEAAFNLLKRKISEAPLLALPNLHKPFELETDASGYAMGAVLMQVQGPVAYYSELFQGAQLNYSAYDKELLALHQAIKHWRCYLLGKETVVHTDHRPLQYLQSQSKLQQARHMKWMSYLQQFNIVIKYKQGSQNKLADMLSRPPQASVCLTGFMQIQPSQHDDYVHLYMHDPDFCEHYKAAQTGIKSEYTIKNHLLEKDGRLCIPKGADHTM
ncbi:uncharacterized protein LOC116255191 [Nymphaea colorata]|uniref:uncharacterized protein LOC116255191 n=1 Tax=Nymphaea colorata TaxID=210225 RepID=UPI00214E9FF2|nr:uncharacterized protein LOC116255191 [Nymphaea colorata]